jgi:hypothetical protein
MLDKVLKILSLVNGVHLLAVFSFAVYRVTDNAAVLAYKFIADNAERFITYEKYSGLDLRCMSRRYAKCQIARKTLLEQQAISETEKILMIDTTRTRP